MKTYKTFVCENCQNQFQKELRQCHGPSRFCSKICRGLFESKAHKLNCKWCKKDFVKSNSEFNATINHFCSRSCAASYHNTQRRRSRRSKSEALLHTLLVEAFPTLDLISNDKSMLNGLEIDIAIPSLKLAIEWNGIVHFKPIYGQDKLNRIQSIDQRKQELANQLQINLIVIPDLVSNNAYVQECFLKIRDVINDLLQLRGEDSNLHRTR